MKFIVGTVTRRTSKNQVRSLELIRVKAFFKLNYLYHIERHLKFSAQKLRFLERTKKKELSNVEFIHEYLHQYDKWWYTVFEDSVRILRKIRPIPTRSINKFLIKAFLKVIQLNRNSPTIYLGALNLEFFNSICFGESTASFKHSVCIVASTFESLL